MWRVVRTPYGGPVPTPRDSAVANQLIDLEDWGGNIILGWGICYGSGESSAPSPGVSESCRRCGELVFGMGNSRSGVGNLLLEWGFSFWCGQLSFRCGELVCGVGNSHSGVGRLFLMWETPLGVGHQIVEWEITLGVGRLLLGWGVFHGLPARFYRRIEPGTSTHSGYRPPARPFLRNSWSGAFVIADASPGTD